MGGEEGNALQRLGFRTWRVLPQPVRQFVVRRATPSYSVGAIVVIERSDGSLLLIRNSYRQGWGFPGGFLKRGEAPADAARRETGEEVGVEVVVGDNPKVVVDAHARRVDVIFGARPVDEAAAAWPRPQSPEIVEVSWFPPDGLPALQDEAASALIQIGRANRPPAPRRPAQPGS
ncbi:MAG: NUDIX hydrolase [Actinomycetota bacterium]